MLIAANIFGVLGIASTVFIYQQKNRKALLVSKLLSDLIWFLHYFFLGAYSGAAIAAIGAVREIVFVNREKKWGRSRLWLPFFLIVSVVCTVLTWKNAFSILTCVASCLSVVGFYIGRPKLSRVLSFPISACMLTYDIASQSYPGIANEVLAIASSIVGLLRFDRGKRRRAEESADPGEKNEK